MSDFQIISEFKPQGDQPQAIDKLAGWLEQGNAFQTLLGVTGSGKTFTMAHVIQKLRRPALVISHNKTLAAQLYEEFRQLFPQNAVEYFVSYYDYYQPEAYIPQRDIYIEKDAARNDELDRLRLSTTTSLMSRDDVIIVASVSCIFGLGSPEDYKASVISLRLGDEVDRNTLLGRLADLQYDRNDIDFSRSKFRVRGDVVELWPSYESYAVRIEFSATRSKNSAISIPSPPKSWPRNIRFSSIRPNTISCLPTASNQPARVLNRNSKSVCCNCGMRANCWRPSVWKPEPCMTWR
jgi:excinuclease ABC subunit B